MPFDLNSAQPVQGQPTQGGSSGGFDLSSAQPVGPSQFAKATLLPADQPAAQKRVEDMTPEERKAWNKKADEEDVRRLRHLWEGVEDPVIGLGQLVSHLLPESISSTKDYEDFVKERDRKIQEDRAVHGEKGMSGARLVGNLVSGVGAPEGKLAQAGAGALNMLRRATQSAKVGAVIGAEQPVEGAQDTTDFYVKKLEQVGLGGLAAGIIRPVAEGLVKAADKVVSPIVDFARGIKGARAPEDAGVKEVLRRVQQDLAAGGPTAQDMLDILNSAPGKPLTLMDVGGENVRALAGRVARAPGESRQVVTKFLNDRDVNAGLRLNEDVQQGVAKGSAFQAADALEKGRSAAAAPLYDGAYKANKNMSSDVIESVLDRPAGRKALKTAAELMQNKGALVGRPDPELLQQAKDADTYIPWKGGVASGLKLQTLDYVKQALYDQEAAAFRAGNNNEAKTIGDMRRALTSEMDRLDVTAKPGKVGQRAPTKGLYQQAREAYSGPSQSLDALEAGKAFASKEPEQIAAEVAKLSPGDKEFYKLGAASALRRAVNKTGPYGDEALKITGNADKQAQLRPLFDSDEDFKKFVDSVKAETRMAQTKHAVIGGSQTAPRGEEDRSLENEAFARAGHGMVQALHGNPFGAIGNWMRSASLMARTQDPAINASIARLLTSPLQPAQPGMQLLNNLSQYLPTTRNYLARAAAPVGRAAAVPAAISVGETIGAPQQ